MAGAPPARHRPDHLMACEARDDQPRPLRDRSGLRRFREQRQLRGVRTQGMNVKARRFTASSPGASGDGKPLRGGLDDANRSTRPGRILTAMAILSGWRDASRVTCLSALSCPGPAARGSGRPASGCPPAMSLISRSCIAMTKSRRPQRTPGPRRRVTSQQGHPEEVASFPQTATRPPAMDEGIKNRIRLSRLSACSSRHPWLRRKSRPPTGSVASHVVEGDMKIALVILEPSGTYAGVGSCCHRTRSPHPREWRSTAEVARWRHRLPPASALGQLGAGCAESNRTTAQQTKPDIVRHDLPPLSARGNEPRIPPGAASALFTRKPANPIPPAVNSTGPPMAIEILTEKKAPAPRRRSRESCRRSLAQANGIRII